MTAKTDSGDLQNLSTNGSATARAPSFIKIGCEKKSTTESVQKG